MGWATFQFRISNATSPMDASRGGNRCVMSRPTMPRMIRSSVTSPPVASSDSITDAVPQDRDRVRDRLDLLELVRDQDAGDALGAELAQQLEQLLGVVLVERGCGLVEDQQLDVLRQRLGDLDQLLLADADPADLGVGRLVEADLLEQLDRLGVRLAPVDDAARWPARSPRKMFSVIESSGMRASSWWMMTMPLCSLSRMVWKRHSSPL